VSLDLSDIYTYTAYEAFTYGLLNTFKLNEHPFKDMPECVFPVEWSAGPTSQAIVLLKYADVGCCSSGNVPASYVCDPAADGSIIQSWVRGATDETPTPLQWGAFQEFVPVGLGGVLTVQKWAMRQGKFLPYGWQDDAAKNWTYLLWKGAADLCTGDAFFTCETKAGYAGKVLCISPNHDFGQTEENTAWMGTYVYIPERNNGGPLWQGVDTDADCDRYPSCYPTDCNGAPDDIIYTEPSSCDCRCGTPNTLNCASFGLGVCPFEPADNWPPPP
jgi:hypothetical protein